MKKRLVCTLGIAMLMLLPHQTTSAWSSGTGYWNGNEYVLSYSTSLERAFSEITGGAGRVAARARCQNTSTNAIVWQEDATPNYAGSQSYRTCSGGYNNIIDNTTSIWAS